MIPGIDVSNHQGAVNWVAVAASGQQFAIIKASEGVDFTDGWFANNWRRAKAQGLVRGAYHYGRPSESEPEDEAEHFLDVVVNRNGLEPGDLLVLDMEDTNLPPGSSVLDWTLRFLRHVTAAVGFRPILYSGLWYMRPRGLIGNAELGEHGLWLAEYDGSFPDAPLPWAVVALWQYSSTGQVPGVAGNCDLDWFNGDDVEQLRRYGLPEPTEPVQQPPAPDAKAEILAMLDEVRRKVEAF